MNNEIKILLTIELEGGTLIRESKPVVLATIMTKEKNSQSSKKGHKEKKREITHYQKVPKPAFKHVKINTEAFKYMISEEFPSWGSLREWRKVWPQMNAIQRLEIHLQRICEHEKGKSFTYTILKD